MKKALVVLGMVLAATSAYAADLDVNAAAAIDGSYGLEVIFNGNTQLAYVLDDTPANETTYHALFKIDIPSSFDFARAFPQPTAELRQEAYHMLFGIRDVDQAGNARQHLQVHIKKFETSYKLFARAYDPTNPLAAADGFVYRDHLGNAMEVNLPGLGGPGYPVIVLVEWQAESANGANDGIFTLKRANNFDPSTFTGKSNTQMGSYGLNIDEQYVGAPGGVDVGTTGSYYIDSYESYRTLAP